MILQVIEENPSNKQYAFFFSGIIKAECMNSEMFAGYTAKEIRELLECKFLYEEEMSDEGKIEIKKVSIEDISKQEFSIFLEKVIAWLAKNEIIVKSLEEYHYGKDSKKTKIRV